MIKFHIFKMHLSFAEPIARRRKKARRRFAFTEEISFVMCQFRRVCFVLVIIKRLIMTTDVAPLLPCNLSSGSDFNKR